MVRPSRTTLAHGKGDAIRLKDCTIKQVISLLYSRELTRRALDLRLQHRDLRTQIVPDTRQDLRARRIEEHRIEKHRAHTYSGTQGYKTEGSFQTRGGTDHPLLKLQSLRIKMKAFSHQYSVRRAGKPSPPTHLFLYLTCHKVIKIFSLPKSHTARITCARSVASKRGTPRCRSSPPSCCVCIALPPRSSSRSGYFSR